MLTSGLIHCFTYHGGVEADLQVFCLCSDVARQSECCWLILESML